MRSCSYHSAFSFSFLLKAFMKSLIKRYKAEFQTDVEEARPAAANGGCEDRLVEALLLATSKKPAAMEHVNIAAELAKLGLDAFFPIAVWPPTNAVRKLATKMRRLMKAGVARPFIAVELRE